LVSCLFFEDFPEVLSIADVRRGGEKYRGGGPPRVLAIRRWVIARRNVPRAEVC